MYLSFILILNIIRSHKNIARVSLILTFIKYENLLCVQTYTHSIFDINKMYGSKYVFMYVHMRAFIFISIDSAQHSVYKSIEVTII